MGQECRLDSEVTDCPLCGSASATAARRLFVAGDRMLNRPGEFPVVRCIACGFVYLTPRPTTSALGSYYPDTYYPLDEQPSTEARAVAEGSMHRVAEWRRSRALSASRLLDVGCGTGLFLSLARNAGMSVQGIELSPSAVAYARARYGLDVHEGTLETAHLPDGSFDIITMWHVLEHLPDPIAALGQLARALAPGGLLLIGVPNIASTEARIFGRRWYSLDAPRHLCHFAPDTLTDALARAGLETEQIIHSSGTAGLVYSIMGDLTGVSLRLRHRPLSTHTYRRLARAIHAITKPICCGLARMHRGGALEVYAVKPVHTGDNGAQH